MLNNLISYCASKYTKDGKCQTCNQQNCLCEGNNDNTCYSCIKHIHNISVTDRHYDCPNLIYNYVIKHSYRYASEIAYAIDRLNEFISDYPFLKVWSIGCGPCSEYFGLKYIAKHTEALRDKPISFTGFDFNVKWEDVNNYLTTKIDPNIKIYNNDCFECNESPNIIILNYMLSDFCKRSDHKETERFISNLVDKIKGLQEVCVIINDVFLLSFDKKSPKYVLDYMNDIESRLKNDSNEYKISKHYFNPQRNTGVEYGEKYPQGQLLWNIPQDIKTVFDPFSNCNSCQLIIAKTTDHDS